MGLSPLLASGSTADEQSNGCSIPSLRIDTERRLSRPHERPRRTRRSRRPGPLVDFPTRRGASLSGHYDARVGGTRHAGWPGVKLGPIAVRATRGAQEKSVAGLDVSGFIEGWGTRRQTFDHLKHPGPSPPIPALPHQGGGSLLNDLWICTIIEPLR